MTRTRLALAAGLLAVAAFAVGHQVARLDSGTTTEPAAPAARSKPRPPAKAAKAIPPDPTKLAPKGIELDDPSRCSFGGTCLSEKYHLLPLRG